MFQKGQAVKPVGVKSDLNFFMLDPDKIYHIKEFTPPEECAVKWPERKYFQENGGRITVSELPTLEWFGTRFVPVI